MASGIGTSGISGGSPLSAESSDSTESLEKTFQIVDTGKEDKDQNRTSQIMDTGKKEAEDQNVDAGAQKDDNDEEKLDILAESNDDDHDDGAQIQFDLPSYSYINEHKQMIRASKVIGREVPFLWTVLYFLFFHEPNEVTTKYYGLYFVGFCTIVGCEAIFSHKIEHYMDLEPLNFFDYLLKILFSVFVSFVGEIEGRDGRLSLLQCQPRLLAWLPLLMFSFELAIPGLIIASKMMIKNRPFWNQCYSCPNSSIMGEWIKENSAKLNEIGREEKEITFYFGKKWLVDFAIVFGSALLAHLPDMETKIPILHFYGLILLILARICSLVLFCSNRTRTN